MPIQLYVTVGFLVTSGKHLQKYSKKIILTVYYLIIMQCAIRGNKQALLGNRSQIDVNGLLHKELHDNILLLCRRQKHVHICPLIS
jgi:hypothetical protein